jgi:hypothetical protein
MLVRGRFEDIAMYAVLKEEHAAQGEGAGG